MRKLASHDRSTLIRLASTMPKGNVTRRAILAGLSRLAEEGEGEAKPKGKGPGKDFIEYMKEVWDGGKKKVSNPNPDSRKTYPEVAVSTAMKDKKSSTYKQVMDGFKKWTEEKKNKDKSEGKKTEEKGEKEESGSKGKFDKLNGNQIDNIIDDLNRITRREVGDFMYNFDDIDEENTDDWASSSSTDDYNYTKEELLGTDGIFSRMFDKDAIKDIAPNFVGIDDKLKELFKDPKNLDSFLKGLDNDIEEMKEVIKEQTKKYPQDRVGQFDKGVAEKYNDTVRDLEKLTGNLKKNLKKVIPKYHEFNDGVENWKKKNLK